MLRLILACLMVAGVSCGSSDSDKGSSQTTNPGSEDASKDNSTAPGDFVSDFKTSDVFFTLTDGLVDGSSPHGRTQIWYSKSVESYVGQSGFAAPNGTVAIKEFDQDSDGHSDGLAVMIKDTSQTGEDYTKNGFWYYAMYSLDGELQSEPAPGANGMCISCHAGWKDQDYLSGLKILAPQ